jgi:hypothetical protein
MLMTFDFDEIKTGDRSYYTLSISEETVALTAFV